MESDNRGVKNRLKSILTIIKHGMFWHGVRNNVARLGLDVMPYHWSKATIHSVDAPTIKANDLDLKFSVFGESEINFIKSTIKGIENKNLLAYLKNGETCIGLKQHTDIVAFLFIRRQSFYFRNHYFNLGDNDSYLHSMYVFEKYRGRNIASYLRYQGFTLLEKEGITNFYSISEYFNKSAIKYQRKSNSQPIKLYLSVIVFKKKTLNYTLKSFKFATSYS
ncbi:acetyltransferase (GNAT) family protein [Gelidibacter algens]|uniref:Acetyltransferase (GNAT) family protein n=1 Tax=Gelidibacter algens TaxID=49280 RepID=A0A1A7R4K7_9FLAO|nr:GNAT family N-acetyltransferase [Gelidibacter algens]OBX27190.1 hypothetical protein A9996_00215 [Gelidibacter algens]RAJ22042.1 acetyltransferase (GNAT) family protein [Gelidibacter algens]